MYLNKSKIATFKIVNAFIIAVCSLPAILNLFFFLFVITTNKAEKTFMTMLVAAFFAFLFLCGAGIIIWRIAAIRRMSRVRFYNSLIEEDHDGIITYETIASMTGKSEAAAIRDLMWFTKKRYLINVTLGRSALRVDVIPGVNEFVTLSCPACGSQVKVRKGGGGKCDHCGTFMREKEN